MGTGVNCRQENFMILFHDLGLDRNVRGLRASDEGRITDGISYAQTLSMFLQSTSKISQSFSLLPEPSSQAFFIDILRLSVASWCFTVGYNLLSELILRLRSLYCTTAFSFKSRTMDLRVSLQDIPMNEHFSHFHNCLIFAGKTCI